MPTAPKREPRSRIVKVANREIATVGLSNGLWTDLYHRSMTASWPGFFATAALIFLAVNSLFALLFLIGDRPIANTKPGNFLDLLYFSIETFATVGYGDMHPQTHYAHLVATIEIFTGMSLLAVMTGLIFARFSRPRARFLFANQMTVSQHDGKPTLMIRMANARHNTISGATARLWLVRNEPTPEGQDFRRFRELELQRRENPFFILSWTLFHTIDETSPLWGVTPEDLGRSDTAFTVNVTGLDETSSQQLNARQGYLHTDIRWRHRYVDILAPSPDGRVTLDYRKFHEVEPDGMTQK